MRVAASSSRRKADRATMAKPSPAGSRLGRASQLAAHARGWNPRSPIATGDRALRSEHCATRRRSIAPSSCGCWHRDDSSSSIASASFQPPLTYRAHSASSARRRRCRRSASSSAGSTVASRRSTRCAAPRGACQALAMRQQIDQFVAGKSAQGRMLVGRLGRRSRDDLPDAAVAFCPRCPRESRGWPAGRTSRRRTPSRPGRSGSRSGGTRCRRSSAACRGTRS